MKYVYSKEYLKMKLKELKERTNDDIDVDRYDLNYLVYLCNKYNLSMDFFVFVEK